MHRIPPQDYSLVTILVAFVAAAVCVASLPFLVFSNPYVRIPRAPRSTIISDSAGHS